MKKSWFILQLIFKNKTQIIKSLQLNRAWVQQVVIGSFLPGHQLEQKPLNKKPKYEHTISFGPIPANPIPEERYEASYNRPKPNLTTSASFHGDNLPFVNSVHHSKITDPENNVLLPSEDSRVQSHEITCWCWLSLYVIVVLVS